VYLLFYQYFISLYPETMFHNI